MYRGTMKRTFEAMRIVHGIPKLNKYFVVLTLASIAIILELYYSICSGSCSYLKGSLFGIPLESIGIVYMGLLMLWAVLRNNWLLTLFVSAGLGIEFYLVGFQVVNTTYCLYCLAFASIVCAQFILCFRREHIRLILLCAPVAFIFFAMFFTGSVTPVFD
jgi:hypothetical protein